MWIGFALGTTTGCLHADVPVELTVRPRTASAASAATPDPEGRAMLAAAQRMIAAYHDGHRDAKNVLRVVYFHPSDRDPLPNYAERLDRMMTDISDFYRDGLRRFGIENDGLPLERENGRLRLHVVKGKKPASDYHYNSGDETAEEIRAALKNTFDLDREHTLVLYALCRREPDGRYVFDAPYYGAGWSDQRRGLCHAADCELLDPLLLTENEKKMVYTEPYYPRMEQTVAKFNSWYLGGVAHELGHGLGLDHTAGSPAEKAFGTSLMGMGNHTYRQEVWQGGAPTYLSRASALQLLAHPFFTGSNRGRWDASGGEFDALSFSTIGNALRIDGKAGGKIAPYAIVARAWPVSSQTDHGAISFAAVVQDDGRFKLSVESLAPDTYRLQLIRLHVNGGTDEQEFRLSFDRSKKPDAATLNETWLVGRAETAVLHQQPNAGAFLTDAIVDGAPTPDAQRRLRILRAVLDPAPPIELANVTGDRVFLSDVSWTGASVGWGQVARNHYWFDDKNQKGVFLMLRGDVYEKGLYAHSPSRYVFALDAKWKTLAATIGLRDGANPRQGSAVFTVRGDGRELYRSAILRPGSREKISLDVAGVNQLELLADGGEGHNFNSWAIWAEPILRR